MKRLHDLSKGLHQSGKASEQNTRRIAPNFPLVERKLDVITGDQSFAMGFPLTNRGHSAILTLKVKPDNCCECDPGAQTQVRDGIGYWNVTQFGPANGIAYPVVFVEPLDQTGSDFNYGYGSPFFYPIYHSYGNPIAGYTINPTGGIVVPVDGVYSVLFKVGLHGQVGSDGELILSIRTQTPQPDGTILEEIVSRKIYSRSKGNLSLDKYYYQYATCIPVFGGATVGAWVQANDITNWSNDYGRTTNDSMRINLLGLGYGTLIGKVFDVANGTPLMGATVTYSEGFGGSATTDEFGYYAFDNIRPATYNLTASKSGYTSMMRTATVYFNKITEMDFDLVHV